MSQNLGSLCALRGGPDLVRLHGHRGARGVFPENTLEGFAYVFSIGVEVIELDVLATRDGIAVVTHNPTLMADSTRDCDGAWLRGTGPRIDAIRFDDLQKFDVGGLRDGTLYGDRFSDQAFLSDISIPSLAMVTGLIKIQKKDIWLNLEVKSDPTDVAGSGNVPDLVAAVLAPVKAAALEKTTLIQSFDWRVLREVQRLEPQIATSYLSRLPRPGTVENVFGQPPWMDGHELADHDGHLPQLVRAAGGSVWSPHHMDLSAKDLSMARQEGLIVNVWTVNDAADLDRMIAMGVDGIITDFPARAQRRLRAAGKTWVSHC